MRTLRLAALGAALAAAGCATRPASDPLTNLRLHGEQGRWEGLLTRQRLTFTAPEPIAVSNPGFPCPSPEQPCFFGSVGHSRYVNAVAPDGRRFSLVADREPCRDGAGRMHPYKVRIGFHGAERLTGCAGPAETARRARR